MIKLSKDLEYALMALKYLKSRELTAIKVNVKTLAEYLNAPFDPLSRVMQRMCRSGYIKSVKGAGGGYCIDTDLKRISLNDLISSLQGPIEIVKCMSESHECSMQVNCEIKQPANFLNTKLVNFYKEISLCELLNGNEDKVMNQKEVSA